MGSDRKTCYAQSAQKRALRAKMVEIMQREATCDLKEFVSKLMPGTIGQEIQKKCQSIFPLQDVYIRKVKVLKKPRFDVSKLPSSTARPVVSPLTRARPLPSRASLSSPSPRPRYKRAPRAMTDGCAPVLSTPRPFVGGFSMCQFKA